MKLTIKVRDGDYEGKRKLASLSEPYNSLHITTYYGRKSINQATNQATNQSINIRLIAESN